MTGSPRRRSWIGGAPAGAFGAGLALVLGCVACGAVDGDLGTANEAIYGGAVDDGGSDGVVAVRVGTGTPFTLCTGALVAPGLVLTAWHCVAASVSSTVSCSEAGQSLNGPQLGVDVAASDIGVYTGVRPNVYGAAAARGVKVFHAQGDALCNDDVAFVALDRSLAPPPLRMRLGGGVHAGEVLRVVGYGENDGGFGVAVRVAKDGLVVRAVGAGISASQTPLGTSEFELGKSACQGDSGGPAFDGTGAIVGIVSRGGACTDDFGHVFMQPAGEPAVIDAAFTFAGAQPLGETLGQDGGGVGTSGGDAGSGGGGNDLRSGAHACSARIAPGSIDERDAPWPPALLAIVCGAVARRRHSRRKSSTTLS